MSTRPQPASQLSGKAGMTVSLEPSSGREWALKGKGSLAGPISREKSYNLPWPRKLPPWNALPTAEVSGGRNPSPGDRRGLAEDRRPGGDDREAAPRPLRRRDADPRRGRPAALAAGDRRRPPGTGRRRRAGGDGPRPGAGVRGP